ncbi:hypothetical protein [Marinobacter daepoensis]|nr:hypothetical protein [Marinobacter daepoensis]
MPAFFEVRNLTVRVGSTNILPGQVTGGVSLLWGVSRHGRS